ncbi:hypothetical protein INT43_005355, partial [Umbelopsis isabellina]
YQAVVARHSTSVTMTVNGSTRAIGRLFRAVSIAPMIDVTNPHFLQMLRIISPRYTLYTEMIHANAIINNRHDISRFVGDANPDTVVQLGGCEPQAMATAAKIVQDHGFREVNINVGCPSDRVQHGNFGAVLMKSPHVVANILNEMNKKSVNIPVTIKCRTGVDKFDSLEFLQDFIDAQLCSERPPPHFIIHARKCFLQGLSPKQNRNIPPLDYNRVWKTAQKYPDTIFSINGGFKTVETIADALTKVDGCMIGREVMDNPMFLQQLDRGLFSYCARFSLGKTFEDATVIVVHFQQLTFFSAYVDDFLTSKPAGSHLPSMAIMMKPLMMLYRSGYGRRFRRALGEGMTEARKSYPHKCHWDLAPVVYKALEQAKIVDIENDQHCKQASM